MKIATIHILIDDSEYDPTEYLMEQLDTETIRDWKFAKSSTLPAWQEFEYDDEADMSMSNQFVTDAESRLKAACQQGEER